MNKIYQKIASWHCRKTGNIEEGPRIKAIQHDDGNGDLDNQFRTFKTTDRNADQKSCHFQNG